MYVADNETRTRHFGHKGLHQLLRQNQIVFSLSVRIQSQNSLPSAADKGLHGSLLPQQTSDVIWAVPALELNEETLISNSSLVPCLLPTAISLRPEVIKIVAGSGLGTRLHQ